LVSCRLRPMSQATPEAGVLWEKYLVLSVVGPRSSARFDGKLGITGQLMLTSLTQAKFDRSIRVPQPPVRTTSYIELPRKASETH
ncbi:MAG: hypothetical protein OEY99_09030, partial [Aigarchaeota archaeon]|nr:hypothetical protein [Aigarchaeota archaeon]